MKIDAIVFDVDSTLTSGPGLPVVESAIKAINALQKKGIKIVISSGRPSYAIPAIEGKIFPDYYAAYNGHVANDAKGNVIYQAQMSKDLFDRINEYCDKYEVPIMWKFTDLCCFYRYTSSLDAVIHTLRPYIIGKYADSSVVPPCGALIPTQKQADEFMKVFGDEVDVVNGGLLFYDLNLKGVNKATGLEKLFEHLGIDPKNTMAFGDSDNDKEMLEYCGVSVAMGNGFESIKAICDYVTDDADKDGILKALYHFGLLEQSEIEE